MSNLTQCLYVKNKPPSETGDVENITLYLQYISPLRKFEIIFKNNYSSHYVIQTKQISTTYYLRMN